MVKRDDRPAKTWGPCTLNNYTEDDITWLKSLEVNKMTCSKEVGEEGTPHLQFHVTFKRAYRFAGLKKLHNQVSWRIQDCPQDNNYSRKRDGELIIDVDNTKKKGARTDLQQTKEIVQSTNSMRAVCEGQFNYQCMRTAELYLKYCEQPRPIGPIKIYWLWGESGAGKSRYPYDHHEEVFKPINYKWWEGYDGHKVVLIDEFRKDFCTFHDLLAPLTDIYPFRVETKGGSRQVQFDTLYFTSCFHWRDVYDTREDLYQLERRITDTIHFTKLKRNA